MLIVTLFRQKPTKNKTLI